jgi:hypothetical protein
VVPFLGRDCSFIRMKDQAFLVVSEIFCNTHFQRLVLRLQQSISQFDPRRDDYLLQNVIASSPRCFTNYFIMCLIFSALGRTAFNLRRQADSLHNREGSTGSTILTSAICSPEFRPGFLFNRDRECTPSDCRCQKRLLPKCCDL